MNDPERVRLIIQKEINLALLKHKQAGNPDVIAHLLKKNDSVFIYDMHPILGMYTENDKISLPIPILSYFNTQPVLDNEGLDYYTQQTYKASPRWWFHHTLSDIFQVAINNHLRIVSFKEYPHDISNVFGHLEGQQVQLPLSYTLICKNTKSQS